MSVTQVWERLFIGDIGDAMALAVSNPNGIKTLVTLCPETLAEDIDGVNHRFLPMLGNRPLPARMFREFIATMFVNVRFEKVLIHSLNGVNRAPVMVAAWMAVVGYRGVDAALVDIGTRCMVHANPILLKSVQEALW